MATSSSRVMKSSLVVVLLLSAVVASQAHQVSCKNTCEKATFFNGIWTDVGETTVLEVKNVIVVEVDEGEGVKHVVKFNCPEQVQALEFVSHGGGFEVTDVNGLRPTLLSGRRTLRESDRLGGKLDLVSKHRWLQGDSGMLGGEGAGLNGNASGGIGVQASASVDVDASAVASATRHGGNYNVGVTYASAIAVATRRAGGRSLP